MKKNEGRVNWARWRGKKKQRGFRGKWLNEGQQGKQSRPVTKTTINITGEVKRRVENELLVFLQLSSFSQFVIMG